MTSGLGAIKVTIGMFFVPGGYSTQHRGVASDIVIPSALDASADEIGEKTLDNSLPPKKLAAFTSKTAYVTSGKGKWDKVKTSLVEKLRKRSKTRVANDKKFQEIIAEVKKEKNEPKETLLADSFKDMKEKKEESDKKKKQTDAEKEADYLKREDINEAVNVAFDMVDVKKKVPFAVIAKATKGLASEKRKVQSSGKASKAKK